MKTFSYECGPKNKETHQVDESLFPEVHEGGEYRWSGASRGLGSGGQTGNELPEANKATAVWFPDEEPTPREERTTAEEYRETELILNKKRSPGPDGNRAPKEEVREAYYNRNDALKLLNDERN
ncbi:hypothetical protein [Arthrobacter sp. SAFR-014]|uniref:hypothetical protein n=1 Tax=unclassified Arthrobacter TaxID=235627 RepID=UPI003F7CC04A